MDAPQVLPPGPPPSLSPFVSGIWGLVEQAPRRTSGATGVFYQWVFFGVERRKDKKQRQVWSMFLCRQRTYLDNHRDFGRLRLHLLRAWLSSLCHHGITRQYVTS